jgi:hypothetical protein
MYQPSSYQFSRSSASGETILVKFHSSNLGDTVHHFVNFLLGAGFDEEMVYDSLTGEVLDRTTLFPDQPHT